MNSNNENLVIEEQQKMRAKQEAARRETAGTLLTIRKWRKFGWIIALIPFVGIAGSPLFMFISFLSGFRMQASNPSDFTKECLSTLFQSMAAFAVAVVTMLVGGFIISAIAH